MCPLKVKHKTVGIKCDNEEWIDPDLHEFTEEDFSDLANVDLDDALDGYVPEWDETLGLWKAYRQAVDRAGDQGLGREFRRGVDDDFLMIRGAKTTDAGAVLALYGGDELYSPGSGMLYIGDFRSGKTPDSKFTIDYMADGAGYEIFRLDKDGNMSSIGTVLGVDVDDHHARHEDGGADEIDSPIALAGIPNLSTGYEKNVNFFMTISTTLVVVTGSNQNITVAAGEAVLSLVFGFLTNTTSPNTCYINICRDNNELAFVFVSPISHGSYQMFAMMDWDTPSPGNYLYQLKAKVSGATGMFYPIRACYILMRR